jgi:hypothetical protein
MRKKTGYDKTASELTKEVLGKSYSFSSTEQISKDENIQEISEMLKILGLENIRDNDLLFARFFVEESMCWIPRTEILAHDFEGSPLKKHITGTSTHKTVMRIVLENFCKIGFLESRTTDVESGHPQQEYRHNPLLVESTLRGNTAADLGGVVIAVEQIDIANWRLYGMCRGIGPEEFFSENDKIVDRAKKICAQCRISRKCLEFALENKEKFGVWGGLTAKERRDSTE